MIKEKKLFSLEIYYQIILNFLKKNNLFFLQKQINQKRILLYFLKINKLIRNTFLLYFLKFKTAHFYRNFKEK